MPKLAILLPDIVDSTPLYIARGDDAALKEIGRCLDMMRGVIQDLGGRCVHTKGDDILSVFEDPAAALEAGDEILNETADDMLKIHAGLHFGSVIEARGAVFGEAVILCARLASMAKPGELLASRAFVDALGEDHPTSLRRIDPILPKGSTRRVPVFSLTVNPDARLHHTDLDFGNPVLRSIANTGTNSGLGAAHPDAQLRLEHYGEEHLLSSDKLFVFGRAPECDLVARAPWVSRRHATIALKRGRIELSDQSSLGTYVLLAGSTQFHVHRETVILPSEGVISPVLKATDERAELLRFSLV
ncbi:MAG: adenylate/guanylate cyclase domain-containing protein [Pseudomonadota bacterium]